MKSEKSKDPNSGIREKLSALADLIETLRGENGCPWDRKQTPQSMSVYLVEEMFELVDAIAKNDPDAVCEELGDVLFHVLFVAAIFQERNEFGLGDAMERITEKMLRRHPHVFGDATVETAEDVKRQWHEIKKAEKIDNPASSILDSIPKGLPALMRAYRISERAARAGFEWENMRGVVQKAEEEWSEFKAELDAGASKEKNRRKKSLEFGDVLFTMINVARFAGVHPETALAESTGKFEKRFKFMEKLASDRGKSIDSASRDEWDEMWETAKSKFSE